MKKTNIKGKWQLITMNWSGAGKHYLYRMRTLKLSRLITSIFFVAMLHLVFIISSGFGISDFKQHLAFENKRDNGTGMTPIIHETNTLELNRNIILEKVFVEGGNG